MMVIFKLFTKRTPAGTFIISRTTLGWFLLNEKKHVLNTGQSFLPTYVQCGHERRGKSVLDFMTRQVYNTACTGGLLLYEDTYGSAMVCKSVRLHGDWRVWKG